MNDQLIIREEFKVIQTMTRGRSAKICEGISLKNGRTFAVKLQDRSKSDSIIREATILRNIQEKHEIMVDYGLPLCHSAGIEGKYNFELLDLLASNLDALLKKCKGIFKVKTFLMLADQMLRRLEFLHGQGYIHRSISLKKFLIGLDKANKRLYLCGLGNGKRYLKEGVHIPYQEGKKVREELHYLSMNGHLGIEGSRRDDLESLMYCWVKMLYGKLPWEGETDPDKILSKKIQNSGEVIFASFPSELGEVYDYCRKLGFDEQPDYQYLRNSILSLFSFYGIECDYIFDWQTSKFVDLKPIPPESTTP